MIAIFERQRIFAILVALAFMGLVVELVRRRKLREEYAWLWLLVGLIILALAISQDLLVLITRLVGAIIPTSTAFFLGLIFLLLLSVYYSIKISHLVDQIKNLAQSVAILQAEVDELVKKEKRSSSVVPVNEDEDSTEPPSALENNG